MHSIIAHMSILDCACSIVSKDVLSAADEAAHNIASVGDVIKAYYYKVLVRTMYCSSKDAVVNRIVCCSLLLVGHRFSPSTTILLHTYCYSVRFPIYMYLYMNIHYMYMYTYMYIDTEL